MDLIGSLIPGFQQAAASPYTKLVEGRVLYAPSSETRGLTFAVKAFDGEANQWGPCPWPTRGATLLPAPGDRVLAGFTGPGNDPWILGWWPVGRGYEDTRV